MKQTCRSCGGAGTRDTGPGEEPSVCGACEGTGLQEPCSACQRLKPLDEHLLCQECRRVLANSRARE